MAFTTLRENLHEYVQKKSWYWYVPFWLLGVYQFVKLLEFKPGEPVPSFLIAIASAFNFILHEMAHLLFGFLPHIYVAAAGSLSEIFLGVSLIVTALLTKSYFANLFCGLWFMLSCFSAAGYMADARSQSLPLISFGGGDPIHDWNFVFTKLGVLEHDILIANIVRGIGITVAAACLLFSAWLIIRFIGAKSEAAHKAFVDEHMNKIANRTPGSRPANENFIGGDLYPSPSKGALASKPEPESRDQQSPV